MIDAKALLIIYSNALNRFDLKRVEAMFAPHAIYISPGLDGEIINRDQIMKSFRSYFAEFADQTSEYFNIELILPNAVRSNWKLSATSNKTGKRVSRSGSEIMKFDDHGLIIHVEVHDNVG